MNEIWSDADRKFMSKALELAQRAADEGEVPVGAVLVENGEVLASCHNAPIGRNDVSAHAELLALRQACELKQNYRLPNTTLYVTLEPCSMCAGAIVHARIERVVIATKEPRAGAAGSALNVLNNQSLNHRCLVEFGLNENESSALLKKFFKNRRLAQKNKKQKVS
ncbi:MAG: tRNA adenosine(34) deaminase TadA [Gammaproteobacteria bacterium]|nr:tRNA adenosine(34) deaminase TadA [Gammaproteobacteria bacterium]